MNYMERISDMKVEPLFQLVEGTVSLMEQSKGHNANLRWSSSHVLDNASCHLQALITEKYNEYSLGSLPGWSTIDGTATVVLVFSFLIVKLVAMLSEGI